MHDKILESLMREAIELAKLGEGFARPNPIVGAVVAIDGKIVGRGYHARFGEAHAEVNAIADARANGVRDFSKAILCVTLEPCSHAGKTPPCADLIIATGIRSVACGMIDPNPLVAGSGAKRLEAAGIAVTVGVLEAECRALNRAFIKHIATKLPYVTLKLAITVDGKIATASGESRWISCAESRDDAHRLRGRNAAIMCGIGTALADDPMLNVRNDAYPKESPQQPAPRNPVRVIVDSRYRLPPESRLARSARDIPLIVAGIADRASLARRDELARAGANIIECADSGGRVDLRDLMRKLGTSGMDSILIEGGGELAWSALEAGVVDRARFYIAPMIFGGRFAQNAIGGSGVQKISDAYRLENIGTQIIGSDLVMEGDVCSRD